ncbi:hypothetical protein OWR28_11015 [Chryseobacterium sp. 1B4]
MRNHLLLFVTAGTLMLASCTKPVNKNTDTKTNLLYQLLKKLPELLK